MDRDANAALNILSRGLKKLGLGQSEAGRPVETALALALFTSSDSSDVVDVQCVVETGSGSGSPTLTLTGAASAAEWGGVVHW
jgi:hypothetical protein